MKTVQNILIIYFLILGFEAQAQGDYERVIDLRGYWKFNIGDNMEWAEPGYDDSQWYDMYVPSAWENEGFHGYDGYAWYRVGFQINKYDELEDEYYLDLGYIDDVDEVYVNGELIGLSGTFPPDHRTAFNSKRFYLVPNDILDFVGVNTIAIRVYDSVIDGGIVKGRIGLYKKSYYRVNSLNLKGIWQFRIGRDRDWVDPDYDDSSWDKIMVPSYWKGYKQFYLRDVATYRKVFQLPERLQDEDELVIVLGKIDDFDRVYLNGHPIGYTKDDRPFGQSRSYQVIRIYGLDERYLNRYGDNVITVEVEDLGGHAGIYEGPIGIVSRYDYREYIRNR